MWETLAEYVRLTLTLVDQVQRSKEQIERLQEQVEALSREAERQAYENRREREVLMLWIENLLLRAGRDLPPPAPDPSADQR